MAAATKERRKDSTPAATPSGPPATATITPRYVEGRSRPDEHLHIWAYEVTITLDPDFAGDLQLTGRNWLFTNAAGKQQRTPAFSIRGERPILSWERPTYRYRSGLVLDTDSGVMEGDFIGMVNGQEIKIPVLPVDLNRRHPLRIDGPPRTAHFPRKDEKRLAALVNAYNERAEWGEYARLDSADFPPSIRPWLEDWILKRDFNHVKAGVFELSLATDGIGLSDKSKLPDIKTFDLFIYVSIDNISIVFVYDVMDKDALKHDLFEVLLKHGILSDVKRELLARQLSAQIAEAKPPRLLWEKDRRDGEDPARFAWRAYSAEAEAGTLHRGLIAKEDKPLAIKLASWLRSHPMPEGIDIPTLPEWNTRQLEASGNRPRSGRVLTHEGRLYQVALKRRVRATHLDM